MRRRTKILLLLIFGYLLIGVVIYYHDARTDWCYHGFDESSRLTVYLLVWPLRPMGTQPFCAR